MGLFARLFRKTPRVKRYYTSYNYFKICTECPWVGGGVLIVSVCPECGNEDIRRRIGRVFVEETYDWMGGFVSAKRTFVPRGFEMEQEPT